MNSSSQSTASGIALAFAKLGISSNTDSGSAASRPNSDALASSPGGSQGASRHNTNPGNLGRDREQAYRGSISRAESSSSTSTTTSSSWVSVSPVFDGAPVYPVAEGSHTAKGPKSGQNRDQNTKHHATDSTIPPTGHQPNASTRQTPLISPAKGISAPPAQQRTNRLNSAPQISAPQHTNRAPAINGPVRRAQTEVLQSNAGDPLIYNVSVDQLPITIIAHSEQAQSILDMHPLAWGVQYELARGVTNAKWTWNQVIARSNRFRGTNGENAYKVSSVMLGKQLREAVDLSIWHELDREQAAIVENEGRGLGLKGPWLGESDWYGGRIQQAVEFVKDQATSEITLRLLPMEKRRCFRFARFLGSRRVLIVRGVDTQDEEIMRMMHGKFVLCGRVFIAFHMKDNSHYLVEINEDWQRKLQNGMGDHLRLSFRSFIQTFNDLSLNRNQPMSKWTTRWSLGLSNTVPVVEFNQVDIIYIDDEYSPDWNSARGKAPTEKTMTDGCGFINPSALAAITQKLQLGLPPAAVQGRIAGAKGLWVVHPTDRSTQPKIWIRASQNKIRLLENGSTGGENWHERVHRIFDFVSASHVGAMTHISTQSIINLSHNGVPDKILQDLMIEGLRLEVDPFLDWEKPHADVFLWDTVNKAGRVAAGRLQRLAKERGRALGLQKQSWGDEWADSGTRSVDPDADVLPTSSVRDEVTKAPLSLHEKSLELLQAGFMPNKSQVLWRSVKTMMELAIDDATKEYRIPIPKSTHAYIIPDPLGVLEEGQIYYRSSQPILDQETQSVFHALTGECLIGRYPLRVASDIQRVVALDIKELSEWSDVIILPIKGVLSLASYLSGGDYDGDTAFLIWDQDVVKPFRQPALVKPPPDIISANFSKSIEAVVDFSARVSRMLKSGQMEFQKMLIDTAKDHRVGMYSAYHDIAVYMYGYDHPEAERLGHLFNLLLDCSKSGLRLLKHVHEKDKQRYDRPPPPCLEKKKKGKEAPIGNTLALERHEGLGPFILEGLARVGVSQKNHYLEHFHHISPRDMQTQDAERDVDLIRPYLEAMEMAGLAEKQGFSLIKNELDAVERHVKEAHDLWSKAIAQGKRPGKGTESKEMLAEAARFFANHPPVRFILNVDQVKASYAYYHARGAHFAFSVAFGTLCQMKASASPSGIAPTLRKIDELKHLGSSALRVMGAVDQTC